MADLENVILRRLVDKVVNRELGNLMHEFGHTLKGLNPEDSKKAALLVLDIVESSFKAFVVKMRERVQKDGWKGVGGGH